MKKSIIFLILCLTIFSCTTNNTNYEGIEYKKINVNSQKIHFITKKIYLPYSMIKYLKNVFICKDLKANCIKIYIKDNDSIINIPQGIGPDQIYQPGKIKLFKNQFYVSSFLQLDYLYKIKLTDYDMKANQIPIKYNIQRCKLPNAMVFDDFQLITQNMFLVGNTYWGPNMLQIIDMKNQKIKKLNIKAHEHPIMGKFNINKCVFNIYNNKAYVIESIIPSIRVIDLNSYQVVKKIELNPPFFEEVPKKYKISKYDIKTHKQWMGSWTSLSNIMVKDKLLIIQYKKGYDYTFYYELFYLNNPENRYFMGETNKNIFSIGFKEKNYYINYIMPVPESNGEESYLCAQEVLKIL